MNSLVVVSPPIRSTSRCDTKSNSPDETKPKGKSELAVAALKYRTFIDEGNEDLVVIGGSEVLFSRIALCSQRHDHSTSPNSHHSPNPMSVVPSDGCTADSDANTMVDALHVALPQTPIVEARRFTTRSGVNVVAALHGDDTVAQFYVVPRSTEKLLTPNFPTTASAVHCTWSCRPSNLRHGYKPYPLQTVLWMKHVPADPNQAYCLIAATISIDLISVSVEEGAENPQLVRRFTTHTDYWWYDFGTNVFLSVNQEKPQVVKLFYVEKSTPTEPPNLKRLPQFKTDEVYEEEARSLRVEAQMRCPRLRYHLQPLMLYGDIFVAQIVKDCIVLYRWKTDGSDADQNGSVEKYCSLQLTENSVVSLQVVDNLLLAHHPYDCATAIYDIRMNRTEERILQQQQEVHPSTQSFSTAAGLKSKVMDYFWKPGAVAVSYPPVVPTVCMKSWAMTLARPEEVYLSQFYCGTTLPLALDRLRGTVSVVKVSPAAVASALEGGDHLQRLTFLLNRSGCGGSLVLEALRGMVLRKEPIIKLGGVFELICRLAQGSKTAVTASSDSDGAAAAVAPSRPGPVGKQRCSGYPFGLPSSSAMRLLAGNVQRIYQVFPELDVAQRGPLQTSGCSFEELMWDFRPAGDTSASPADLVLPPTATVCLGQREMFRFFFVPLQNDVKDGGGGGGVLSPLYLLSLSLEYVRCLLHHGYPLTPHIQQYLVERYVVAAGSSTKELFFRLHQLLMFRSFDDHEAIAMQFVALSNTYPPALQIALDMLCRLQMHRQVVEVFLAQQMPLRAARYALNHEVRDAPLPDILRCAALLDDAELIAAAAATKRTRQETGDSGTFYIVFELVQRLRELQDPREISDLTESHRQESISFEARYRAKVEQTSCSI